MTDKDIKKNWKDILIPFTIYIVIFIAGLLLIILGSKSPTPKPVSYLITIYGLVFIIFYGVRIKKFKKNLESTKI